MFNSVDTRVLLIGAVALIVAVYEGPGTSGFGFDTPPVARSSLVRCAPSAIVANSFADLGWSDPVVTGDVTSGGTTTGGVTPVRAPASGACR